jgi:ubiquinone/menaquinone biosynthesis C-methylase UbiE
MAHQWMERLLTHVGTRNESERASWVKQALAKIPAGARILDAGAGEQPYKSFCSHLRYVAQDFARYDGMGNGKGLQTGSWNQSSLDIVCDITAIPEPDASYDAVLCLEVLEHLPEPLLALGELSRLLKPGGQLILTAPFCSLTHFAPYHFITGFSIYFYRHHLPLLGLEIMEAIPNGNYFEYLAQELRRLPQVAEQYANEKVKKPELLLIGVLLRMLDRFSRKDNGSSNLLNYGYHLLARKR